MLDKIPTHNEIENLLSPVAFANWQALCKFIEAQYEMEQLWNKGGKAGKYEYKYRRGGKTLCALYLGENHLGFMVVLGKAEQQKFEELRNTFTATVQRLYDETHPYHDGRWLMLDVSAKLNIEDIERLLHIKRRPNKKHLNT